MAVDFIMGRFPRSVIIDGIEYSIRWDYRTGMQFEAIQRSDQSQEEKIIALLQLYYPEIPHDISGAIDKLLWFYRCGEEEKEEKEEKKRYQRRGSDTPAYSFSQDAPYIYSAFREQYGIDLTETDDMHWWKFIALFDSLSEETKMSKIMYYRKASTSGMPKERRAFLNEMKKLYEIRTSGKKKLTLEQRNKRWMDYVKNRQMETRQEVRHGK